MPEYQLTDEMKRFLAELNAKAEVALEVAEEARIRRHNYNRDFKRAIESFKRELGVPAEYVLYDIDGEFKPDVNKVIQKVKK